MSTDTRPQADALINFLFDQLPVRGVLLQLGSSWREVVALQRDAERRLPLLADSLAATTMMASTMKLTGMLTLQLQGGAGLGMLIAQCDAQLGFRGMCGEIESEDLSFAGPLAGGRLSMTVEARRPQDRWRQRWLSITVILLSLMRISCCCRIRRASQDSCCRRCRNRIPLRPIIGIGSA